MDNIIKYEIKSEEDGLKLKEYLRGVVKLSSRFVRCAIQDRRIKVNGEAARINSKIKCGDIVEVKVNKKEEQNITPQKMELDIVYEDNDIIVVNKKPGIVVHPTKSYNEGTLSNGLLYYFKETGQDCIVRLVSRLDMDTSGLIIVGKNQFAHMALARDMQEETFEKSYMAIVHGNLKKKKGTIDVPIYRVGEGTRNRVIDERGQRSITHYEVVESYKDAEFVKLTLETGRTHQIRVHMNHIGHPLFGDTLYGSQEDEYIKRQALHAFKLAFPHPRDGKIMNLECELPQDMKELISKLKEEANF